MMTLIRADSRRHPCFAFLAQVGWVLHSERSQIKFACGASGRRKDRTAYLTKKTCYAIVTTALEHGWRAWDSRH
eukprot:321292-Amphidinium_carterae.1